MTSNAADMPRKRGRPKLSEEEKARRAKERAELKKTNTPTIKTKRTTKKQTKSKVTKETIPESVINGDDGDPYIESDLMRDSVNDETNGNLRRYTFVIEEDVRHFFGSKCDHMSLSYVPASYVVNQLMKMFIDDEVRIEINQEELVRKWYTVAKVSSQDVPEIMHGV